MMEMIVAIIRPEKLEAAKEALSKTSVHGLTIIHVTGRGE